MDLHTFACALDHNYAMEHTSGENKNTTRQHDVGAGENIGNHSPTYSREQPRNVPESMEDDVGVGKNIETHSPTHSREQPRNVPELMEDDEQADVNHENIEEMDEQEKILRGMCRMLEEAITKTESEIQATNSPTNSREQPRNVPESMEDDDNIEQAHLNHQKNVEMDHCEKMLRGMYLMLKEAITIPESEIEAELSKGNDNMKRPIKSGGIQKDSEQRIRNNLASRRSRIKQNLLLGRMLDIDVDLLTSQSKIVENNLSKWTKKPRN